MALPGRCESIQERGPCTESLSSALMLMTQLLPKAVNNTQDYGHKFLQLVISHTKIARIGTPFH